MSKPTPFMEVIAPLAKLSMADLLYGRTLRMLEDWLNAEFGFGPFNREFSTKLHLPYLTENSSIYDKANWAIAFFEGITAQKLGRIDPETRVFHIHYSHLVRPKVRPKAKS